MAWRFFRIRKRLGRHGSNLTLSNPAQALFVLFAELAMFRFATPLSLTSNSGRPGWSKRCKHAAATCFFDASLSSPLCSWPFGFRSLW